MSTVSPEAQLAKFLAKYDPEIASLAEEALAKMRQRLPGAVQMVYDNYNALVIGFGPSEKASESVFSIALYPRWVNLFFLHGADLTDSKGILNGTGSQVRSITLQDARELDKPAIKALMNQALRKAPKGFDKSTPGKMVIKAISARQRPRRPK